MPSLTENQSAQIVALLEEGYSQNYVARRYGVHRTTIARVLARYRVSGSYRRRVGQGRRRITTDREDRRLLQVATNNPRMVAHQIQNIALPHRRFSDQTVRNRLHERGLRSRVPARAPHLTQEHRRSRRDYARNHQLWSNRQWSHVLFTDESRFCLYQNDARMRIWRRRRERFLEHNMDSTRAFGGGSVMVWGGISRNHRTELIVVPPPGLTSVRYVDEILRTEVVPMRQHMGHGFILMHDNARSHTARWTRNFLERHDVEILPHPAMSPDLNPIEHVWDMMDRRLRRLNEPPRNLAELEVALNQIWHGIPQDDIRACINMQERLQEVIRRRGGPTRY